MTADEAMAAAERTDDQLEELGNEGEPWRVVLEWRVLLKATDREHAVAAAHKRVALGSVIAVNVIEATPIDPRDPFPLGADEEP